MINTATDMELGSFLTKFKPMLHEGYEATLKMKSSKGWASEVSPNRGFLGPHPLQKCAKKDIQSSFHKEVRLGG